LEQRNLHKVQQVVGIFFAAAVVVVVVVVAAAAVVRLFVHLRNRIRLFSQRYFLNI